MGGDLAQHSPAASSGNMSWPSWGGNIENNHFAASENTINTSNVNQLSAKWIYKAAGPISATPTITDNDLYITDWGREPDIGSTFVGGFLHNIDITTGNVKWQRPMRSYNDDTLNNISRSSPAIFQDLIIIADVQNPSPLTVNPSLINRTLRYFFRFNDPCGAYVYGINRHNGELAWSTRIGTQLFDQVSQSPTIYNDTIFVGVSSQESTYTRSAKIPCCQFRGSVVALDAHTGAIKWRTYMINDNEDYDQYAGAAVWGGAPTIDPSRNMLYVPTGNNYWTPASVQNCLLLANGNSAQEDICLAGQPENHFDSIVALDMDTGNIQWATSAHKLDAWNTACDFNTLFPLLNASSSSKNCPYPKGPDSDFAQAPMLVRNVDLGGGDIRDMLFAGTKGGEFFGFDANDGAIVWRKQVGPGGLLGGMQFGAATDNQRIYIQNTNTGHENYQLVAGNNAGKTIHSGFWAALDPATGNILWQTQVPGGDAPITGKLIHLVWGTKLGSGFFAWPMGGLTVANGVVFAGVANLGGTMVAMDASNGNILWQMDTGQSIASSPSVVNGRVYWGTGYKTGTFGFRLYSLGLP